MYEKKLLADEELEQVSGGRGTGEDEYCKKWYHDLSRPARYVYVKKANYDFYYVTEYTLDEAGNVSVRDSSTFRARLIYQGVCVEVSIAELPDAVRRVAGC